MKIEIGENLIASYLKHVEGCRIVQANWKTSSRWTTTEYEEIKSRELFEKISSSPSFKGVFKGQSYEQLIKQAEIDVLGINTAEKSVFGVDVAFHSAGLNYGRVDKTKLRVLKKLFRAVFVLQTYFKEFDKFNSYFITPKVNRTIAEPIRDLIEEANNLIGDEMVSVQFICNDSFFDSIVNTVINNIDDDNDTAELFLRSVKLLQLDKRASPSTYNKVKIIKAPVTITDKTTVDGMKIGQFVRYKMRKLYERNLVSEEEISNLQNKDYSKKLFDITYEVLRSSDKTIIGNDGIKRYYANEKFFDNYFLCSQWKERHCKPFLDWLEKIEKR